MTDILKVPTIYDTISDFQTLFRIWDKCNASNDIRFDFSDCIFIKQNGVAFLAGLSSYIRKKGGNVSIDEDTLTSAVKMNLAQNGFIKEITGSSEPWGGNSIPLRKYTSKDVDLIEKYLEESWIRKGWIHVSDILSTKIVGNVIELYANAFEHSKSEIEVFTCGQHFPKKKDLALTIIDFGIGIPQSVNNFFIEKGEKYNGISRLETAFQYGFSTKEKGGPRGLGLDLLKNFIQKNNGSMEIYSNNEYARIRYNESTYIMKQFYFHGTAINIKLKCDEKYYVIDGEPLDQLNF